MINFAQVINEDKGNSSKLLDILLKIEKKYFDCFKITSFTKEETKSSFDE